MTQSTQDLAKVQAFYYSKIAEGMSPGEACKLIQFEFEGEWVDVGIIRPHWDAFGVYRIKPQTTQHPGGEYPTPVSEDDVVEGEVYYLVDPCLPLGFQQIEFYYCYSSYILCLKRGFLHKTEEAALQHFNVLVPQAKT